MADSELMNQLQTCCQIAGIAYEKSLTIQQATEEYSKAENENALAVNNVHVAHYKINRSNRMLTGDLSPRIVIIGAGLSGLTCAYRLCQSGICPIVFDAANRPGGRCFTIYNEFAEGQTAEAGGELIDSDHLAIIRLAHEFGLSLGNVLSAETRGTQPCYFMNGRPYACVQATAAFQRIYPKLMKDYTEAGANTTCRSCTARSRELDTMSVTDWINQTVQGGVDSDFGKLLSVAHTVEFGAETSAQSALNIVTLLGSGARYPFEIYGKSDKRYHIQGGNSQLVSRLMDRLPGDTVRFNTQLTAIRKCCDHYQLDLLHDSEQVCVGADIVLLAVPFTILRSQVDYRYAGFSPRKELAIETLGMGTNAKLNVQFQNRHWIASGCSGSTFVDKSYQSTWEATRGQPGEPGILGNLTGGSIGASMSDPNALPRYTVQFLSNLNTVLPGIFSQWNGKAMFNYWAGNPWSLGSRPFYKVGGYTSIAGVEGKPEGNCFFAGDHTSLFSHGCMNGAVESGERAAGEILDSLMKTAAD